MSQSLRRSEKWFRRGLWIVALVFASFLIGLGGVVMQDLPNVERRLQLDDFSNAVELNALREAEKVAERTEQTAERDLEQAELQLDQAKQISQNASETFTNWIATRRATQLPSHDAELVARTQALDNFKTQENQAWKDVQAQRQIALDARQAMQNQREKINQLEDSARVLMYEEQRRADLRVFGYRLLLTLPLLLIAAWLFVKKRKTNAWPFVWGFIFFAVFVFFVELVPYLPSYGGYVRYIVGIIATAVVGRYAIVALNQYLTRQRQAEQQSEQARREELSYDLALTRLAKAVCPGCERSVDLKNTEIDFCPHCGMGLFNHCEKCNTRKSAFAKFCHACGLKTSVKESHSDE